MSSQDEFTATISFKHDMLLYAQKHWPTIAADLNKMFKINPPLSTDNIAGFEFFLAILFIQSRAPYNIYNDEIGDRIWNYLKNTFAVEPQYGNYANEALDCYYDVWNEYIKRNINPLSGVTSILLYKLGQNEKDVNVFLGTVFMDTLALFPPWWKNFSKNSKLIESDIPLNLEDFKKFVGENTN